MKQLYLLFFFILFFSALSKAQADNDSLNKQLLKDTISRDTAAFTNTPIVVSDSVLYSVSSGAVSKKPVPDSMLLIFGKGPFWREFRKYLYSKNSFIGFTTPVITNSSDVKLFNGKESLFYYFVFLLILFGLLRLVFGGYFNNLFRVFFRTTLKQKQVREQLLQSALPSILLNGFFVITAGMYVNLLLGFFRLSVTENFWLQYLYCMLALSSTYLLKFLGLKISGWLFNVSEATDSYIFIVFIINKMVGILLLPLLVLIAFTAEPVYGIAITLSWVGLLLLYGYRFILSYGVVRNEVKLNPFHFIIYLIAFEIIPLLLIYKLLLLIF